MTEILVIPAEHLASRPEAGTWPWLDWSWPTDWQWMPRAHAERDERFLQIIPYALITDPQNEVWCYRRSGGDARLLERLSCGVGGHIDRQDDQGDLARTAVHALRREVAEELGWQLPERPVFEPHGWIFEERTAIGRVHLGLVFVLPWFDSGEPQPAPDEQLAGLGFWPQAKILADDRFELWSHLAVACLSESQR